MNTSGRGIHDTPYYEHRRYNRYADSDSRDQWGR
jgi:hypothetical protein